MHPTADERSVQESARQKIAALEREAKLLGDSREAALLFHEVGRLWEEPLGSPRNAAVAYQSAHRLAPDFLPNLRDARRLFESVSNWQIVLQLLDAELRLVAQDGVKAHLLLHKANILEVHLARREEATRAYQEVLALKPRDAPTLLQLEEVYTARADRAALVEIYKLLADVLEGAPLRAHYLTSAGYLLEEHLAQPEEASECFYQAFVLDQTNPLLLSAVIRSAERDGRDEELVAALTAQANLEGADATHSFLRLGKIYNRLGRKEEALGALLAARKTDPHDPLVLSELSDVYESAKRYQELTDLLLSWAESGRDENEMVSINLRLAALYEDVLKKDTDAIARYKAILARNPSHASALSALGRLYYRTQNWNGLLATFEAEAAALSDPKQRVARLYKAAEVVEERLNKTDEAVARYNRCLQLVPEYVPAQQALVRIYERNGRYLELISLHEQEVTQFPQPAHAITALTKMAVLYEDRLNNSEHAVDCLRRILALDPKHLPTIRALARLFQKSKLWQQLIEANEMEASLTDDPKQALALRQRNAEILEDALKDRPSAVAAYRRLLESNPSYPPALKALGRLCAQEGRWEDLAKMYRAEAEVAQSTDHAATLMYKVGELHEHKLNDLNAAITAYREALTLSPSNFPALRALERLYRAQESWESLIEVWRAEAASRMDPVQRANALFQAATLWEEKLRRADMAAECFREVLRLNPNHLAANRSLERYYTSQNSVRELVAVLDREVQSAKSSFSKLAPLLKLAYVYLDGLGEISRAAQCCDAAMMIDAQNITALKLRERIGSAERNRNADLKPRPSPGSNGDAQKSAQLKRAFEEDPANFELAAALEQQLRQAEDPKGLLDVYQKRLAALSDDTEKIEVAMRIAALARYQLGDFGRAMEAYVSALRISPQLLPALQGTREVALALGDYAAAVKALEAEAAASRDSRGRIDAWLAAGCIAAEKLNEPDSAIAHFRRALEIDPSDQTANTWLQQILSTPGYGKALAEFQESAASALMERGELNEAGERFTKAAMEWAHQVHDRDKAISAVDQALRALPSNPEALELQGRLMVEAQRYSEAAEAFSARLRQGGNPETLFALNMQLGVLYQDHLRDPAKATSHLQAVIATGVHNSEALERLSRIYTEAASWQEAADCLTKLLETDLPATSKADHTLALAKISDEGLSDVPRAIELYQQALELGKEDISIVSRLSELHQSAGTVSKLVEFLDRLASGSSETGFVTQLRIKLGELHGKVLNQPATSAAYYKQVMAADPSSISARLGFADVLASDPASVPQAIQEYRELLRIEPLRLESLHALCRIWSHRQEDRAFCAAGILYFMRAGTEAETAFYVDSRSRIPDRPKRLIETKDLNALLHQNARSAVVDVISAIGDQLGDLYPPMLKELGINPKTDRLKSSDSANQLISTCFADFGVTGFELYQAPKGIIRLDNTDPPSVLIGPEFSKMDPRQQRFFIGRAAFVLAHRMVFLPRLSLEELMDLVGNSIRIHAPTDERLGRPNEEASKQLRKRYSRKALKALALATEVLGTAPIRLDLLLQGLAYSADRAGLLLSGDVASCLSLAVRESAIPSAFKDDPSAKNVEVRADLRELMQFAISDDFFRLRADLGLSI